MVPVPAAPSLIGPGSAGELRCSARLALRNGCTVIGSFHSKKKEKKLTDFRPRPSSWYHFSKRIAICDYSNNEDRLAKFRINPLFMGSAVSSSARTGVQATLREVAVKQPQSNTGHAQNAIKQSSTHDSRVTARLRTPPEYQRKSSQEWSESLKKISGAISSSSWEGQMKTYVRNQAEKERHSAQRSDETNTRLPGRQRFNEKARDEHGVLIRPEGRLSQNQIIQMFNLRRADPQTWDAANIAKRFRLEEEDVSNLLSFSRTYAARVDKDGQVRGYYNVDPESTISRFEKD